MVLQTGRTRGTRYFIDPKILKKLDFPGHTTLTPIALHRLMALIEEDLHQHPWSSFAENARRLILRLFGSPAITIQGAMQDLGLKYNPANQLIASLCDLGVLKEISGYRRNRIFAFDRYLQLFRPDSEV